MFSSDWLLFQTAKFEERVLNRLKAEKYHLKSHKALYENAAFVNVA